MKLFFNRKEQDTDVTDDLVLVDEMLDTVQQEICHTEVAAVIALAINQYMRHLHEYEKAVLTFQKIMKPYSPWSSKIYAIRQQPLYMPNRRTNK